MQASDSTRRHRRTALLATTYAHYDYAQTYETATRSRLFQEKAGQSVQMIGSRRASAVGEYATYGYRNLYEDYEQAWQGRRDGKGRVRLARLDEKRPELATSALANDFHDRRSPTRVLLGHSVGGRAYTPSAASIEEKGTAPIERFASGESLNREREAGLAGTGRPFYRAQGDVVVANKPIRMAAPPLALPVSSQSLRLSGDSSDAFGGFGPNAYPSHGHGRVVIEHVAGSGWAPEPMPFGSRLPSAAVGQVATHEVLLPEGFVARDQSDSSAIVNKERDLRNGGNTLVKALVVPPEGPRTAAREVSQQHIVSESSVPVLCSPPFSEPASDDQQDYMEAKKGRLTAGSRASARTETNTLAENNHY
eukprot:TRINITY_DN4400_c1_g2_i1.p1 TRINITY_DN4400_c1_g2~~TRINITY_DN4400_c1_g2_i1.p1  ORF type:complete len:419 (+),score=60.98 TRINITY_DN4400_c1_g2_i1:163-1257(+)